MLHKRDIRGYCSSSAHGESGNRIYELSTQQSDMEMSDLEESGEHKINNYNVYHVTEVHVCALSKYYKRATVYSTLVIYSTYVNWLVLYMIALKIKGFSCSLYN